MGEQIGRWGSDRAANGAVWPMFLALALSLAIPSVAPAQNNSPIAASNAVSNLAGASNDAPAAPAQGAGVRLQVQSIDLVHHIVQVRLADAPGQRTLRAVSPDVGASLALASPGDFADAYVDDAANPTQLLSVGRVLRPVPVWPRLLALAGTFSALLLVAGVVSRWRPQRFLVGADNRYSKSQCQLAIWFSAVAVAYGATVVLRIVYLGGDFIGGVSVTPNLIALTGLSALSFGGARAITIGKVNAASVGGAAPKAPAAKASLVRDLVSNDNGDPDLGDFQMILITVVAVGIFVAEVFHFLGALELAKVTTLPDIDTTLLASFGISQGAYLAKKAASNVGDG